MTPTTSGSTTCTDSSTEPAQTSRWFPRRCQQHPCWPSLVGTPPRSFALQCYKVSLMSCHSSPTRGLVTVVNWITLPLRSTLITRASTLLRAAPPLVAASVFFLMVSATCHFPSLSLIHISEPTRLGMNSYAVCCLKNK